METDSLWRRSAPLARRLGVDVFDGLALAGASAVLYGVSRWSVPAAWVLAGVGLLVLALLPAVRKAGR